MILSYIEVGWHLAQKSIDRTSANLWRSVAYPKTWLNTVSHLTSYLDKSKVPKVPTAAELRFATPNLTAGCH